MQPLQNLENLWIYPNGCLTLRQDTFNAARAAA